MKTLVAWLPSLHLLFVTGLLLFMLYRTTLWLKGNPRASSRGMMNGFSIGVLAVFFSGIAPAFALGVPLSNPFILLKIIGFLIFTALSLRAFSATVKHSTARLLLAVALLLFLMLGGLLRLFIFLFA